MGLLNLYNASITQLSTLDPDLVTQYPSTVTGTPTTTQNPGGPAKNFNQTYDANNTYLSTVSQPNSGVLKNTLNITNLDVENKFVQGGPKNDIVTTYPSWVTGKPNYTQNPGAAPERFIQKWTPDTQYAADNPIAGDNSGILYNQDPDKENSLKITNLDTTDSGVNGGIPYNQSSDPTIYPPTSTGNSLIKGWFAQPSAPPTKFYQVYNKNLNYLEFMSPFM